GIGPGQQSYLSLYVTSYATLMVPSNQRLLPDSLADIQNGSSHIGYFHTNSKTLCEIEDVGVGNCEQSIHGTSEGIDLLVGVP
ncbi:hypothetical protein ABTM49_20740, partial [Acinetobacter baumannii]